MGFKRGTDNVELIKVDAAIDLASTQAITANGEHGTLSFTLAGAWAACGTVAGSANKVTWSNNKVKTDSVIILASQDSTRWRHYHYVDSDGTVILQPVNDSGSGVGEDGTVIKLNYRIIN